MANSDILSKCVQLRRAFENGLLGETPMPEDVHPLFLADENEKRLCYFTLPMSLNYQRDSYKLWQAANRASEDSETANIFNLEWVSQSPRALVQEKLLKHKVGLQPNKHTDTWKTICETVFKKWGSLSNLLLEVDEDFVKLRDLIQVKYKKGFPYLSGPKIFNYWSFILIEYGNIKLKNRSDIEIAPDTHVIQASIKLGLGGEEEIRKLSRDELSKRWRDLLKDSKLSPIDLHSPLWFWSRNGFEYQLPH